MIPCGIKQLEAQLRHLGHDVEILNLGVGSYQMWQHVEQLNRRVSELQPDIVLIGFFMDDLIAPERPAKVHGSNPFAIRIEDKYTGSKLVNLLRNVGSLLEFRVRHQRGAEYLRSIEARKEHVREDLPKLYALQSGETLRSVVTF